MVTDSRSGVSNQVNEHDGFISESLCAALDSARSAAQQSHSTDPVFIVDDLDQAAVLGLARRWRDWSLWFMGLRCLLLQLLLQTTQITWLKHRGASVHGSFSRW